MKLILFGQSWELSAHKMLWYFAQVVRYDFTKVPYHAFVLYIRLSFTDLQFFFLYTPGIKLLIWIQMPFCVELTRYEFTTLKNIGGAAKTWEIIDSQIKFSKPSIAVSPVSSGG